MFHSRATRWRDLLLRTLVILLVCLCPAAPHSNHMRFGYLHLVVCAGFSVRLEER
jgi:hypothetical protein